MPNLAHELDWMTLTGVINEVKSPCGFVKNMLFGSGTALDTETIEVGVWHGERKMAPMVRRDGEAIPIQGRTQEFRTVTAPNTRLKMPFTPGAVLFGRRPGTPIFGVRPQNPVAAHIRGDLKYMRDHIANREEFMCCQALEGIVSYSVEEGDAFQIDYQKPAANSVVLTGTALWTDAASNPKNQVRDAQRLMVAGGVPQPNTCIMGLQAAVAFEDNPQVQEHLDKQNVRAGALDMVRPFTDMGARYLGNLYGIDYFEYSAQVYDDQGNLVNLIDPKKAHFLARSPLSMFKLYYGAIPEMTEKFDAPIKTRVFMKSWLEEDPNRVMALIHSRPLPVVHRPHSIYTVQVVA